MTTAPRALRILMVGEAIAASRTPQRLKAMLTLGHDARLIPTTPPGHSYETRPSLLDRIRYRLRVPPDLAGANVALRQVAEVEGNWDVVWLDNARTIRRSTLEAVRAASPGCRLVWYCEDDMMNPRHRTRWIEGCLDLFDVWSTTKSYNTRPEELPSLGVRRTLRVDNAYDPDLHRPLPVSDEERARFGADVAFVGTFERPRADSMVRLAEAGIACRVWGNGWGALKDRHPLLVIEDRPVYGDDYARAIAASRINLCFLRRFNRDLQTCRSMEIPACGGFMMHERNDEIAALFTEDREAAFFGSDDELVSQCRRWLADDEGRRRVALDGRTRVQTDDHTHRAQVSRILAAAMETAA
ncbi:MAG: glycosyltransferase [Alphaproteobacteria bacterium]